MSLRTNALKSEAFLAFKDAYENREKYIKASGKKAVWMLGADCPEEAIIAAGMLPVRVTGEYDGPRDNADKYLERSFGPIWRGVFEKIVNGKYGMEYLVMANSSDMIIKIFYYLREMKRAYAEVSLPELKYLDFHLTHREAKSQERNLVELHEFVELLEKWSGNKVTNEALIDAGRICNENKQALREFAALRYGGNCRITGSEALVVIGGSQFMEKEASTAFIKKLTEEARSWPLVDAVRVLYTGSLQEKLDAYEVMEAAGANVIFEDNEFGCRYFDKDMDLSMDPYRAIVDRYMFRLISSERGSVKERTAVITNKVVEAGAEALIVFMNFNDESYIWDYPTQKEKLNEMGIPSITFEKQQQPLQNKAELQNAIAKFVETVRGGK